MQEKIIILDFGSQYTQLIARRIREMQVYCEIHPFNRMPELDSSVRGVILSGSPSSVRDDQAPRIDLDGIKGRLPLLGICHGEQIINVAFGGTLWQDLPSQRKAEHRQRAKDSLGYHDVEFAPGSRIARIMGCDRHKTNSFHHQAVRRTADGFRATGISRDGIVEVIEPEDGRPILGVQFHPEISAVKYGDERMRALFDWLLEEARGFAGQKR